MSKTIKQIADELGVSKQAVRKKIDNLGLSTKLQTNGNQFAIDKRQETAIKQAFASCDRKPVTDNQSQTIDNLVVTLQEELKLKNKQIETLSNSLADVTTALAASQQQLSAAQALHAGTISQLPPPKKHFWQKQKPPRE